MYPILKTTKAVLPMSSRKALVDSLCTRAYTAISQGLIFTVANKSNADFIAQYLNLVFQSTFIVRYNPIDTTYYIIPA